MVEQLFLSHACDTFSLHRVLEKVCSKYFEISHKKNIFLLFKI